LRPAQRADILIYSEADFEVFRPAGATRCTDGVKFGKEEGMPTFIPIGATTRVAPKLTEIFYRDLIKM